MSDSELPHRPARSPGMKLLFVLLVAGSLVVPLLMVYGLVWDRQDQSQTARATITRGWGGPQLVTGPVLVVPYEQDVTTTTTENGKQVTRTDRVTRQFFVSPVDQKVTSTIDPEVKTKSIYASVLYDATIKGSARFAMPDNLARIGIAPDDLKLDRMELRFGVSDPRGLQSGGNVTVGGQPLATMPGGGPEATRGAGFHGFPEWDGTGMLDVAWGYELRGSETLSLVPRGGNTEWSVTSPWPHPSFSGSFLPGDPAISDDGFSASYAIPDLALGQSLASHEDLSPPNIDGTREYGIASSPDGSQAMAASIGLIEPVDLYSRIDRSVKYGFLIIGFTFLTFLMFDIVAGVPVAAAEYLLTGAGLVLFFVLLLAFSEVTGFAIAYLVASAAIVGLITAYGAAVLRSWKRARIVGALLAALYAALYVLLSLEAWSLIIGSLLLFAALAGVMYGTRKVDWSAMGRPVID
ncbi:cell envelope integrity protein CreD [Croceicoccus mobilis]|uniref:Cell envelope integrity protein CreD n=1 Tax=Croceicoccus mobilis TaxID=1703339 RepID=A0A917DPW7_9SPHN|nr:cell envelope integrity protein CreD [Croceicoccus mobilis]GGD55107.1 cell envelope integrity protein CreD [Croceicoccus mobilis]